MFKALLLTKTEVPAPQVAITELDEAQLPAGDVLVQVSHSTLNYKDALALTNRSPVARNWPMVPPGVLTNSATWSLTSRCVRSSSWRIRS